MGLFPLVSPVLNGLDRQGSALFGDRWDDKVKGAVQQLITAYGGGNLLNKNRKLIDYSALATQTAYVFRYLASHADFLAQVFAKADSVDALTPLK